MRIFGKRPPSSALLLGKVVQVGEYELRVEAHLGEGGFASIYRVRDAATAKLFALKHVRIQDGGQSRKEVCYEAKIMKKVRGHPNVLGLIAVAFGGGTKEAETDAYMILDLCQDNLYTFLKNQNFRLSDILVLEIMHNVCKAVQHLHKQSPPITHR